MYTLCYKTSVVFLILAQRNKWPPQWSKHWFYYRLVDLGGAKGDFCEDLTPLGSLTAEGAVTEASHEVVDALWDLAQH